MALKLQHVEDGRGVAFRDNSKGKIIWVGVVGKHSSTVIEMFVWLIICLALINVMKVINLSLLN